MPRARNVRLLLSLILALLLPALSAAAEDKKPSAAFDLLSVEGLWVGKTISIDAAFGKEHGIAVPAPFSFVVPLSPTKEYEVFADPAPKPGEAWMKINFATHERQLIENIQFVNMTVPMGDTKARLNAAARALVNEGLPDLIRGKANAGRDVVRAIKIADYDAVEVIAHFDDPDVGAMLGRMVGILNPKGADGVVAIANIALARVPVKTADDFARTRGGTLLAHFKYLEF